MWTGRLSSPYFEQVRDGRKIYEMRRLIPGDKYTEVPIGTIMTLTRLDGTEPFDVRIIDKQPYQNFAKAIEATGYSNLIPDAETEFEAWKVYHDI